MEIIYYSDDCSAGCPAKQFLDKYKKGIEENDKKRNFYKKFKSRIDIEANDLKGETRDPISAPIKGHTVKEIKITNKNKEIRLLYDCNKEEDKLILTNGFEKPYGSSNSKTKRDNERHYATGDYYYQEYLKNKTKIKKYDF
jgi:hypothetical protein